MAEITRPHIQVKDGTPAEQERNLRLIVEWMAQQSQKLRAEAEATYRKKSDRIVADAMRVMEGEVRFDKAVRPTPGQVLYGIDGIYAAFGDSTTPAPTDPGTGPAVGGSNALLDGSTHTDTVAQGVTRGSLIYGNATPKWDELVIGSTGRVVKSDGTDASWGFVDDDSIVNYTDKDHLFVQQWAQSNGTAMSISFAGTHPNQFRNMQFVDAPATVQAVTTHWKVPEKADLSGGIVVKLFYKMIAVGLGSPTNICFLLNSKALDPAGGEDPTAAADQTLTAVIGETGSDYTNTKVATIGTLTTTLAAGDGLRLTLWRDTTGASGTDDSTDTVAVIAVILEYTRKR